MIFTANVIDWQQSVLDNSHSVSNDVWKQTVLMLEILRTHDVSASFFIHPKVASKYPVLIRKIQTAGHEIGCIFDSPYQRQDFLQQAQSAIRNLEDITGKKVIGTRYLNLSIKEVNFDHYCSVLRTCGIQYDSSLIIHKTLKALENTYPSLRSFKAYGISQYPLPCLYTPPLTSQWKLTFGDSTFRLLPYEMTHTLAKPLHRDSAVFHMPVYDLGLKDLEAVKASHILPWRQKLDFFGRKSIPIKLKKLFGDFPFESFKNYYFNG